MDLLAKLATTAERHARMQFLGGDAVGVVNEKLISPTRALIDGRETILAGTNNYMGITFDAECIAAGQKALAEFGTGTTGSRIANGSFALHKQLETEFATFLDRKHCIVFTTGYQANLGMMSGLAGSRDTIYLDADSHSSIYDGCTLSGAKLVRFRHNDAADLDKRLTRGEEDGGGKLVVLEGIYSMMGDRAPLADFIEVKKKHGFRVHKLKGGVYPPAHELECYRALAAALPGDRYRYDPNSALSLADAIDFGHGIEDLANDYFEDPVWGMPQLARLKEFVPIPTATNTVVVNFEQLAANVAMRAVDVILLDTTFWGGIRPCIKAAGVCETMGMGVAVHSSGELGIQLATMLHLGAVLPNLGYAADAHYHHLTDDVIVGGLMQYKDGAIRVPDGNGLGVSLDRAKLTQYHELFKELGSYPYDRDPGRPGWYPLIPNSDWADPARTLKPKLTRPR